MAAGASVLEGPAGDVLVATRRTFPALLPLVGPVGMLAGILMLHRRQLVQTDTWVALVAGREIARHGLPSHEHLTLIAHGHRWVDQQWLAQLALYRVERIGGVGLMIAACTAAALCAFAIAAAAAQARGASPLSLVFWLPVAFLIGPWGAQARTQSLALPLFAFVLWLILRDPDLRRRSSLWAVPTLCLWANLHGSVTLGAAIVAAHALQALVRTGRRRLPLVLLASAPASIFASPYALELPGYYRMMLLHPPYGHDIVEWERTTPSIAPLFFALAGVVALAVLLRRKRLGPAEWVVLGVTFAAALTAVRITPWFGLAVLAVVPPLTTRRLGVHDLRGVGATVTAGALVAGVLGGLAWMARQDYAGPANVAAALRAEPPTARVLANLTLADWALWEAPNLRGRVAYDGRPELLTRREFVDVAVRFERFRAGWARAVQPYTVIVTNRAIAQRLVASHRGWRAVRRDGGIVLVERSRGAA
ncbi:MAG TPA: hypothetical protein VFA19_03760 [Gaiellaceae bacterium]|nr:hypothetical protein [Gaiellaceae bacterium]